MSLEGQAGDGQRYPSVEPSDLLDPPATADGKASGFAQKLGIAALLAVVLLVGAAFATTVTAASVSYFTLAGSTAQSTLIFGMPPWPAPANPGPTIGAAGLWLDAEAPLVKHDHVQLEVFVDGSAVPVPANLGIDPQTGRFAEIHTHSSDGELHVEATTEGTHHTLGQLFQIWHVALSADRIGGLETDSAHSLRIFVNGDQIKGDPSDIELRGDETIVLVYGPIDSTVGVPKTDLLV